MEKNIKIGTSSIDDMAEVNDFTYIGDYCKIGDAKIGYGCLPHSVLRKFDTFIGDNVIIGDRVQVLKGAYIGNGAVLQKGVILGEGSRVIAGCHVKRHLLPFESFDGRQSTVHVRALADFLQMEKDFDVIENFILALRKAADFDERRRLIREICSDCVGRRNFPLQEAVGIIALFVDGN